MAAMRPIRIGFHSLPLACRQGGYGSTNVTFPISFSRVFTPLITAMNDLKTQNNLHINSYWNTGFNCYNNDYAILWIAFGV